MEKESEAATKASSRGSRAWSFLNSSFFVSIIGAAILAFLTAEFPTWQEAARAEQKRIETANEINDEISDRLICMYYAHLSELDGPGIMSAEEFNSRIHEVINPVTKSKECALGTKDSDLSLIALINRLSAVSDDWTKRALKDEIYLLLSNNAQMTSAEWSNGKLIWNACYQRFLYVIWLPLWNRPDLAPGDSAKCLFFPTVHEYRQKFSQDEYDQALQQYHSPEDARAHLSNQFFLPVDRITFGEEGYKHLLTLDQLAGVRSVRHSYQSAKWDLDFLLYRGQ